MLLEAKITGRLRTSFTSVIVFTNNGAFNEQKTKKWNVHTHKKSRKSVKILSQMVSLEVYTRRTKAISAKMSATEERI